MNKDLSLRGLRASAAGRGNPPQMPSLRAPKGRGNPPITNVIPSSIVIPAQAGIQHSPSLRAKRSNPQTILLFILLTLITITAHASSTTIGGYDITKIANETIASLNAKGVVEKNEIVFEPKESSDALVVAPEFVRSYEDLGSVLIKKNIITAEDVAKIKDQAAKSGGLKTDGLNPVVLAAGYLDLLTQKGIIEISAAQRILDSSKRN